MSASNGATPPAGEESRILTLDSARRPLGKSGDFITRRQAEEMIRDALASELPKIHEFYLNQVPPHVSRMILDALLGFGLIKPLEQPDILATPEPTNAPLSAAESQESRENTEVLDTEHDSIPPATPTEPA